MCRAWPPHDPHPDDDEAERLLALLASTMLEYASAQEAPAGETEAEQEARLERQREAQRRQ